MAAPAFVPAIQDYFRLTPAEAGLGTALNAYAGVASGFVASFMIEGLRRKSIIMGLLLAVALCEAITPLASSFGMLLVIRTAHGIFGGVAVATASALIAATRVPDRTYGILLLYNALAGAVGLYLIPRLGAISGALGFQFLAIFCAAGILVIPLLKIGEAERGEAARPHAEARSGSGDGLKIFAALMALYCYQMFHNGLGSFALTVAQELDLDRLSAANGIAIGKITGIVGALVIVLIGGRFGRTIPLLVVAPLVVCEGILINIARPENSMWLVAQILDGGATYYALPLLLGTCAAADSTGRAAIWGPLASKIGIATGPLLGGLLGQALGFHTLVLTAIAGMAAASFLALAASHAQGGASARKTEGLPDQG
jgi:predicted MFS family arabinose efflux permease